MRAHRQAVVAATLLASMALPGVAEASPPINRTVERDHKTVFVQTFPDDICGPRAVTATIEETGHRTITEYVDRFQVVDVEVGTYVADFHDPAIPDITGRYVSPFTLIINKNGGLVLTEVLHEFDTGEPAGIDIFSLFHVTMRDGVPVVERFINRISGCP